MFSISFVFRPGTYDNEFRRLDAATQKIAEATEGYLGSETWWSEDRAVCNAVYFWQDLRHLSDFAQAVPHREAKGSYDRWYDGYQVVVAEIRAAYGDGRLSRTRRAGRSIWLPSPGVRPGAPVQCRSGDAPLPTDRRAQQMMSPGGTQMIGAASTIANTLFP